MGRRPRDNLRGHLPTRHEFPLGLFQTCCRRILCDTDPFLATRGFLVDQPPDQFGRPMPINVDRPAQTAPPTAFPRLVVQILVVAMLLPVAIMVAPRGGPRHVVEEPPRPFDARPGDSVLFLGNSRIFVNDLPKMVRDVADSANSPVRYDVHMRAWAAATLRDHWNDDGDRAALQKPWGVVIIQAQSGSFADPDSSRDFELYGAKLIRAAQEGGSKVALTANWTLGPNFFNGETERIAGDSKQYGETIEQGTRALAEQANADVIDLERLFEDAGESAPEIALTSDGNHPTHAGTFLAAVAIYGYLSHDDVANVTWRPFDMTEATAAKLKDIAARHLY